MYYYFLFFLDELSSNDKTSFFCGLLAAFCFSFRSSAVRKFATQDAVVSFPLSVWLLGCCTCAQ